ncbi:MAG TPA: type II toxin-antitoxin system VapC family toxin [Solirubrobacterales bacterium]|nr:type II toxin-antitoxin system VapC family toxin [Solirubrobacterales bacterium]
MVDASVVVEMLVFGEHEAAARERLAGGQEPLWAPELLDAEVGQALRRAVRRGDLKPGQATHALEELREIPVHRITHELLVGYAWALRDRVSFYDALYVALAEMLGEPLITVDARLGRAGVEAEVEVLA